MSYFNTLFFFLNERETILGNVWLDNRPGYIAGLCSMATDATLVFWRHGVSVCVVFSVPRTTTTTTTKPQRFKSKTFHGKIDSWTWYQAPILYVWIKALWRLPTEVVYNNEENNNACVLPVIRLFMFLFSYAIEGHINVQRYTYIPYKLKKSAWTVLTDYGEPQ